MNSSWRWIKILGIATAIGVALGVGLPVLRSFFGAGAEKLLSKAERAYAQGAAALDGGDAAAAALRFEEANLQVNKALDAVAQERAQAGAAGEAARQEELGRVEGKALWLKVRAVRDLFVAKGAAEGQPLPEAVDSIGGAKFYPVLAIPDNQARQEAFNCLREAARRLSDDAEVQRCALLSELMLSVLDWNALEKTAQRALQIDADDPWALYLLARIDFEQPGAPKSKRSRQRVRQARKYVERLKDTKNYPLWRTLFLEARITQWLRDDAARSNSNRRDNEEAALRSLLFAPQGALARARAGEGLEHPSKWDAEGVLGLHLLALDMAVEDSNRAEAGGRGAAAEAAEKVVELLNATLGLCRRLTDDDAARAGECSLSALQALSKAEPVLGNAPPSDWSETLDLAQELTAKAHDRNVAQPGLYEAIANLLTREAYLEGKRGNSTRQAELKKQALQWVEDGLRLAKEANLPAEQMVGLNTLAAEMKALAGAKAEEVAVYLNALEEAKTKRALTLVKLLKGTAAERDGRLAQARKLLEQVLASRQPNLVLRAHMVLGDVYLALGQPDKALASLQQVVQAYKVFDRLTPPEKSWALEFVRGPEDLALLMISAHVDSALARARELVRRNPGEPLSLDLLRHHEDAIAELRKQLLKQTPQDRQARQIMVRYYSATRRRELAKRELAELRIYYPNSVDVLRTEVNLIGARSASEEGKSTLAGASGSDENAALQQADARIDQFIKEHPSNLDARFFKVEWLIGTQRVEDALAYLRSPAHFADTKSERYQRVLAAALLTKGDRQGSQKVLEHLPHDAATDALLIQAASAADREKLVRQALARHEGNAQFQSWQAVLAFNKGDYEAAAEEFLRSSQYHRFAEAGKRGLLQSFLALAKTDPSKARNLAVRLHKEAADEPVLLLAGAYAALQLDDIGTPGDNPDAEKSMAAVLNAWERMVLEQQPQAKASAPLTKSAFWALAGRQDLALSEAVRALHIDPKDPAALRQAVALALELRDPDVLAATRKRLEALRQAQPDNVDVRLLQARFDEWNERPREALAIYEDLLKKDAKRNEVYARSIALHSEHGDKTEAWDLVKRWRKEQPDDLAAAQTEVRLLAANKDAEQARRVAEAFIDKQKPSAPARLNLQLQMIRGLAQGKAWKAAEDWLNQLLAKHPDQPAVLVLLGDLHVSQSAWDKARRIYEKALAKDNNAVAANNLAWMLAKHFNNAAEALRLVRELRKGRFSHKPISGARLRPEFLDTLGVIYTKMNEEALYPEMRQLFEAARQRYPHDPRMYMYLGHAYAGMLETERAARMYALAVEVARNTGPRFLSAEKCQEVIAEVEAAQKKLKETAQR